MRPYVPQGEILKHATAAITHAGMNSISDLLAAEVPFVCLPLGADQPALASRARELGATVVLDHATATADQLAEAVERVSTGAVVSRGHPCDRGVVQDGGRLPEGRR